jgi:hypothetical protein
MGQVYLSLFIIIIVCQSLAAYTNSLDWEGDVLDTILHFYTFANTPLFQKAL